MRPERLVAPGNDYRKLRSRPDAPMPSVAVVIPVYNRPQLLANVLAGLTRQSFQPPFDVVVIDDGSEEDIGEVVDRFSSRLDIRLLIQERDGFGLARARNLGMASVASDIVAFLDGDCIPGEDWLERHMEWHRKASNLVVTGSRRHIGILLDPELIARGAANLHDLAAPDETPRDDFEPDDWRSIVYRRSQRLLLGDAGFRAAIGGNSSMPLEMVLEAGGASEDFRAWGGEDTEMAWRLWNNGAFVVPEDRAIIYHQTYHDAPDGDDQRRVARNAALALIADRVPHGFYRKEPSHLHTVPRVSWLVTVESDKEVTEAWTDFSRLSYLDTELILIGDSEALRSRASTAAVSRDLSIASTFGDAVSKAKGEVLAIVDARARFDRRLLARAMRRYNDPRVSAVHVAYQTGDTRILRLRDLRDVDATDGRSGLPFFALISRREVMKDREALSDTRKAWNGALDRSNIELLLSDLVDVPIDVGQDRRERLPGPAEARAAGLSAFTRELRQSIGSRESTSRPTHTGSGQSEAVDREAADQRIGIEYVGLAGHKNLGDDAMLEAIRGTMPWAEIGTGLANPKAVMLGGGTLLNAGNYYLNKVRRVDGPNLERIVFGTGVRSEAYWGITEQLDDWDPFLRSALSVGVRGPDSLAAMRAWGYDGSVEVVGDSALLLERPDGVERVDGRVVLCPVHTGGECWGGDDQTVFDEFARTISRLKNDGRDVVMMTAFPGDDRWAIEIMRRSGHPDLDYLAGYEDLDTTLRLLASADLVIGERLHAVVLAAAVGTPFVAVEYRPKVRDFARSVDAEGSIVRTDEISRLETVIRHSLDVGENFGERVAEMRDKLRSRADDFARQLGAAGPS